MAATVAIAHRCVRIPLPQLSLHSPLGTITVSEEAGAIVALDWGWGRDQQETPLLTRARQQLGEYLDGERQAFDLPIQPRGTSYQRTVWAALLAIPYGDTRTYADIASIAGGVPQSVGQANRCNPIPILIPCHRVIARVGIGGYSGADGVDTKRHLLELETRSVLCRPLETSQ